MGFISEKFQNLYGATDMSVLLPALPQTTLSPLAGPMRPQPLLFSYPSSVELVFTDKSFQDSLVE